MCFFYFRVKMWLCNKVCFVSNIVYRRYWKQPPVIYIRLLDLAGYLGGRISGKISFRCIPNLHFNQKITQVQMEDAYYKSAKIYYLCSFFRLWLLIWRIRRIPFDGPSPRTRPSWTRPAKLSPWKVGAGLQAILFVSFRSCHIVLCLKPCKFMYSCLRSVSKLV